MQKAGFSERVEVNCRRQGAKPGYCSLLAEDAYSFPRDKRHLIAEHGLSTFMHIWNANLEDTPRLIYVLYNGLRLLLDAPGSTLLGLPRLLTDEAYRGSLLKQCTDSVVVGYWEREFAGYDERFRTQVISPIQNKIGMLLSPPALRNILGQRRSTINIPCIMNKGRILIANLSKGMLGETSAHLLGAFLATACAQAAESRATIREADRRDFYLYADEFQNFATKSFATVLSEARKWRLSLTLAHQYLAQLPDELRPAVLGNCGSLLVFRVGADDAEDLAPELGIENAQTLTDTNNFSAWTKLLRNGAPTDPLLLDTLYPQPQHHGRAAAVIARTRARHTRPRTQVERGITQVLGFGANARS